MSERPFSPNEIVRLKINFQIDEYTTINEPVLGYFIFHDNKQAPSMREKSFIIKPGNYYEFYLIKQIDRLLPAPYPTDCVNYREMGFSLFDSENRFTNEYLRNPISQKNCIIGCMGKITFDRCNCWPPELPFLKGAQKDSTENQMKWCDWERQPDVKGIEKDPNITWFNHCFQVNENECHQKCKLDCFIDRFSVIVQTRQWLTNERIVIHFLFILL